MAKLWFKLFFRTQKRNWVNLLVNVLGLTLGLSGLIITLLYYSDENLYNQWNPNKEHIYRVLHFTEEEGIWETSTGIEGEFYRQDIPEVKAIYLSDSWYGEEVVTIENRYVYTEGILEGDTNFFRFFPFEIVAGRLEDFKRVKSKVALSEKQAKIYFGSQRVIGKTIVINDESYEIALVFKGNAKSYFNPNIILHFQGSIRKEWGSFSKNLFCKLSPGSSIQDIEQKMYRVFKTNSFIPGSKKAGMPLDEYESRYGLFVKLEKLADIRLHSQALETGPEGKGNYQLILIMFSLSILLIILSSVNFINLSIASASQRAKEIGVKKTFGLVKKRLVVHHVLEICFQGILSLILALIVVEFILPFFNEFLNKEISILQWNVIRQVSIIALVVSFLVGIIPSVYLSHFKPIDVLKGNYARSKRGVVIRQTMLALQFLISGFFLIGAMVIKMQVSYMIEKDLGFNGDQIAMCLINKHQGRYKKYEILKKELIKHPHIQAITSNYRIPGGGNSNTTDMSYLDVNTNATSNAMDFNYLDVLNIPIVKGRGLSEQFASDTILNILINETAAKRMGIYDDPIGKKINIGFKANSPLEVVGVIKDYHIEGFGTEIEPMFLFHWKTVDFISQDLRYVQFKIKPQHLPETMDDIEEYWKTHIEQEYPFEYQLLDDHYAQTYTDYQKQERLFIILTLVVILVALLGLFALSTLHIQQRLKEVAIRKTLGASIKQIIKPLLIGYIKMTLYTSVILLPIAYFFMQMWLNNFVYRISMPWVPFIVTPLVLVVLVVAIVGIKAYKATKIDLIQYLKFE